MSLTIAPRPWIAFDAARDLDPLALLRFLELGERLRVDPAAVACDLRRQLHTLRL